MEAEQPAKRTKSSKGRKALTPLEKQIIELKSDNPDKMLVIQVGYKYKLFGEDARKAAAILNIMFIPGGDDGAKDDQFSYCSFPDFKLHINLKRLLTHGHKIGVIKQMESSVVKSVEKSSRSDLMKRELTAVYTRGTYMGDEDIGESLGDEESGGYIICVNVSASGESPSKSLKVPFCVLAIQPATGEIIHDSFEDVYPFNELNTRLLYLNPSEVIIINNQEQLIGQLTKLIRLINPEVLTLIKPVPDYPEIQSSLSEFFTTMDDGKNRDLYDYYTVNFDEPTQVCVSHMIEYLKEFKLSNIFTIPTNISKFKNPNYMILSHNTIQALEIFQNSTDANSSRGSLVWLLDHTRTRSGKRLLRKWISKPLVDRVQIESRLQSIEDMSREYNQVIDSFKSLLDKMGKVDLEQLLIKVHYSASYNTPRISRYELFKMLECFNEVLIKAKTFEKAIDALSNFIKSPLLLNIFQKLLELSKEEIVPHFLNTINSSSFLNEASEDYKVNFFDLNYRNWEGITNELEEISKLEEALEQELEAVRKLLKRPQLKYTTNNREPYLIEVRNGPQVDALSANFQRINGTLLVSRFRTSEISELYKLLKYRQERLTNSCDESFNQFLVEIDQNHQYFSHIIQIVSQFDCLLSLTAASSIRGNYSKPELVSSQTIDVRNGRNPIIENLTPTYVPNNISLSYDKERVLILTGPNMGGKSSYVKQIGLMIIMAQIGCYLPCDSAVVGIFDSIFIRMGSNDNILKGTSTFMNEMLECYDVLSGMTSKSLIILDEVGRGTSTNDGISIAYAILRYLIESQLAPIVLFITHYPSLHVLESTYSSVINYHMGYKEIKNDDLQFPEIVFLYTLVRGVVNNLYGLNVARLADLPEDVIKMAFEVSEKLKNTIEVEQVESFVGRSVRLLKQITSGESSEKIVEELEFLSRNE
ncbi:uncharacterized protein CANTADRAFT_44171 [Suhomyces tanzawaensis NRRL Y-17324]|uniref:DNA mismatch repair protein MSH3 n=1 Tax=Suhomyces tanzawaensis NRRL Y-17324 TaxID=984487 RepID=A0A1E4SS60_9ASCO|nr:uncharacterized protein CANTADRAFT_44171 [Suhomyces tanzawaensis NRRL Y-17324]ODV82335.1 hypothetical protein CANTADRAFT_44171 [Suhomyces tanzawaensis NRRL Y-17324]